MSESSSSTLKVDYEEHHAVVSLVASIDEPTMIDLVARVRELREDYFYNNVELEIASPGGSALALEYYLEAMGGFRASGLTLVTRALTAASSAAAVLLALGDRREAARSSSLLFHSARYPSLSDVTTQEAQRTIQALSSVDGRITAQLVKRGLEAGAWRDSPPLEEAVAAMHDEDWFVVRRLLGNGTGAADFAAPPSGRDRASLLGRLRGRIEACLRNGEAELRRLYESLFALDARISAMLAKELRLLDEVVNPGAEDGNAPPRPSAGQVRIPHWRRIFPPHGRLDRRLLCRHVLVLGETGCGKTQSAILPAVGALFDPDNPIGCALVVDPKREIDAVLRRLGASGGVRVRRFKPRADGSGPSLNLMRGPQWSLEADMAAGRYLTAARKMLVRSGSLSNVSPGESLAGRMPNHNEPYWPVEGARMGLDALALTLMLLHKRREVFAGLDSPAALLWDKSSLAHGALRSLGEAAGFLPPPSELKRIVDEAARSGGEGPERRVVDKLIADLRASKHAGSASFRKDVGYIADQLRRSHFPSGVIHEALEKLLSEAPMWCLDDAEVQSGPNALALAGGLLRSAFQRGAKTPPPREKRQTEGGSPHGGTSTLAASMAPTLREVAESREAQELLDRIENYWEPLARAPSGGQHQGVFTFAYQCFADFSDSVAAGTLRFGVEPQAPKAAGGSADLFDLGAAVDDGRERTVFLIQPALGADTEDLVAKALKACFFEAVLNSRKRLEQGGRMPLVGYIADECHRFLTSDPMHGEQSFLDTCRSFGAFCVLACQSVSSLKFALAAKGGGGAVNEAALAVLLNNTGTKLFFRSTDGSTQNHVGTLCPHPQSGHKVTDIRPPMTLKPGECYAVLVDGRFERRQLEPYVDDAEAPQPAPAASEPEPQGRPSEPWP